MSNTILLVHGRSFKPDKTDLKRYWLAALRHGIRRDLSPAKQQLDRDEILSVERVPLNRALEMICTGEIQDAKTIAGIHLALRHLPSSLFEFPTIRC